MNRNMSENTTQAFYGGGKMSQLPQPLLVAHSWKLPTLGEQKRHDVLQLLAGDPREGETVLPMRSEDYELIETPVDDRIDVYDSITEDGQYPTCSGNFVMVADTLHNLNNEDTHEENNTTPPPFNPDLPSARDVGWTCSSCTYAENPPLLPGCQVCFQDRPADYKIPDRGTYIKDETEEQFEAHVNESEIQLCEMFQREESKTRNENREELFEAADLNLTLNEIPFDCPICLTETGANEGVRLQECLHEICRDCCANHINLSNDAEIMCPYMDGENACQQAITHREIRQIVGEVNYEKYVKRSLNLAEAQSTDSFHCLTPNCEGFCFYHKDRTFFQCPNCLLVSCFKCKVIHEGQTCREYKDETERMVTNEQTAKQTEEELQRLLREGRAMNCPQCGVVIQKNGGCPNMTCSKCNKAFKWTGIDM